MNALRRRVPRFLILVLAFLLLLLFCVRDIFAPLPAPKTTRERIAMFPTKNLALQKPVTVYWNDQQVPFVDAQTDEDAAYALGMIHAHLRLGQMELARRIVQGRLSEIAGPVANKVDHLLRILDFPHSTRAVYEAAPSATRRWMERFVDGINAYIDQMQEEPHEFRVLGMEREHWKPEDLFAVGRLGGADYTWLVWFTLLEYRDSPKWEQIWNVMLEAGSGRFYKENANGTRGQTTRMLNRNALEQEDTSQLRVLLDLFRSSSEFGSNSVVIGASRSASGAPMIASDPHLGLTLPNLWFVIGLRSPSYHLVGMTAPALPVFAFGRNRHIAWGGTNLHAASSDLYDISKESPALLDTHTETLKNRFWFPTGITYRTSPWGPVISDAPILPEADGRTLALKWIGHGMSDEITSMLSVNRATNWGEFTAAYSTYALPALNMLYADHEGNIGRLSATQVPHRTEKKPRDMFSDPARYDAAWKRLAKSADLPSQFIPDEGFLVSANSPPPDGNVAIGYFYAPPDRTERLSEMIRHHGTLGVSTLARMQRDVFSSSSLIVRDALLAQMRTLRIPQGVAAETMEAWDGYYHAESRGALAYQAFVASFARALYAALGSEDELKALEASAYFDDFLLHKAQETEEETLRRVYKEAQENAATLMRHHAAWGDVHRLRIRHILASAPLIGSRYEFDDLPGSGSRETVMKQAHGQIGERPEAAHYGAQSRHISDMADENANYFVLLGGQDGWIGSENFQDQIALWQKGEYMQVPLDMREVRRRFPHRITLRP
jgi:penicillin amidase